MILNVFKRGFIRFLLIFSFLPQKYIAFLNSFLIYHLGFFFSLCFCWSTCLKSYPKDRFMCYSVGGCGWLAAAQGSVPVQGGETVRMEVGSHFQPAMGSAFFALVQNHGTATKNLLTGIFLLYCSILILIPSWFALYFCLFSLKPQKKLLVVTGWFSVTCSIIL